MKKRTERKWRCLPLLLACLLFGTALSGCGKQAGEAREGKAGGKAMGRYMEEEMNLPEGINGVHGVQVMADGSLWILAWTDDIYVYSSKDEGKTWEKVYRLSDMIPAAKEAYNIRNCDFSKKKEIVMGLEGTEGSSVWYVDAQGKAKELELGIDEEKSQYLCPELFFDGSENVTAHVTVKGFVHVSPKTGEELQSFQGNENSYGMAVCGNVLLGFLGGSGGLEIRYYDLDTGKPTEEDKVLTDHLKKNLDFTGNACPLLFAQGDEEDRMFLCDKSGIYSHALGANVMEQVVDASLCTLGDTIDGYRGFAKSKDNTFYVLKTGRDGISGEMTSALYRYYYNKDIPTVPDEELKVYALDKCPELSQGALFYQKEHPEVRVVVETSMDNIPESSSSSDSYLDQRRADALKVLNTEILAGKGPDVLVLDGMPVDTYMEKGILEDLSGIFKEEGPDRLLPNVRKAYTQEDGKIYAIPARLRIPVVFGRESLVSARMELTRLAQTVSREKESLAENKYIYPYFTEAGLTEAFLHSFTSRWKTEDGTLDEAEVREFMERVGTIYRSDVEDKSTDMGTYGGESAYETGIGMTLPMVYSGQAGITFGEVCSAPVMEQIESMIREDSQLSWAPMGQRMFKPWMTLGVSSKARNKEQAESFAAFLLGAQAQSLQQGNGIPVHEDVLASGDYWGLTGDERDEIPDFMLMGNAVMPDEEPKELEIYAMNQEQLTRVREAIYSLDTPYSLDVQVSSLIKNEMDAYLNDRETLDEAMKNLMDKVNLYLSE